MKIINMIETAARSAIQLDEQARADITSFVEGCAQDDGGYSGRNGKSDLYYTYFALAALTALKREIPEIAKEYLEGFRDGEELDFVHLACLVRSRKMLCMDVTPALYNNIEKYRSEDGGYNHNETEAQTATAYATYLALLALDNTDTSKFADSLKQLKTQDGAYSNESGMSEGTTTATAAALIVQTCIDSPKDSEAVGWLKERIGPRGGFYAGAGAPVPDLLSTAASLHSLKMLDELLDEQRENCLEFIDLLWDESGGFAGSPADLVPDCEYTFYGLLALGCTA